MIGDKGTQIIKQDFSAAGGLNTLADPFSVQENESPNVIDTLFNEDGSIERRRGKERLNDTPTGATDRCNGLFDYGVSPGVRKLVASFGTTLYKMDDLDGTFDSLETGRTDATHYFERSSTNLIICNHVRDVIKYWNGSDATTSTLNTGAPQCRIPKSFQGYLFLANEKDNPRRIYYEDESTITTGDYGEYFALPSSSDDEVVALVEYNGRLYASLRNEWYRISYVGGSAVFDYKKVSSVVGGVPNTIKVVSIPGTGEVIMYLGWNKRIYIFDGTSSYSISLKYEHNNFQSTVFLDNTNQGGVANAHATIDNENDLYRLYIPMGGDSDMTHSFNINIKDLSCSPFQNMRFSASTMAEDSNKRLWHICGDYYGTAYRMDRGSLDEIPVNNIAIGPDGASLVEVNEAFVLEPQNWGTHDAGDGVAYAEDASIDFTTEGTYGAAVGDYVMNKTDNCRGVITSIDNGAGTNARLTMSGGLSGGTDNDFDDDDLFRVYVIPFKADDDSIYVGSKIKFDTISINLLRVSSSSITPIIYYSSDAAGGYTALSASSDSLVDGTSGFSSEGNIKFTPPADWTATNVDDGNNAFTDTDTYYYIRIRRTRASAISSLPILAKLNAGTRIDDEYVSPKMYGENVSQMKKGHKLSFYFKPVANYKLTYADRRDLEVDWKNRDSIPMYSKGDDFLGGNMILGTSSNKLGSREDGVDWPVNLAQVTNSYQYRIKSNKSPNFSWKLYRVELAGKVMGIGSSRNKIR